VYTHYSSRRRRLREGVLRSRDNRERRQSAGMAGRIRGVPSSRTGVQRSACSKPVGAVPVTRHELLVPEAGKPPAVSLPKSVVLIADVGWAYVRAAIKATSLAVVALLFGARVSAEAPGLLLTFLVL
jgi:hypothetical protein